MAADLDHLLVAGFTTLRSFQSMMRVRPPTPPQRNRAAHGEKLLRHIDKLIQRESSIHADRLAEGFEPDAGSLITLKVVHGTLDPGALEWVRAGIKVFACITHGDFDFITLLVPRGKLTEFKSRINEYLTKTTKKYGQPKNAPLVTAIESIGAAAFEYMWTDDVEEIPTDNSVRLFQLWLDVGRRGPSATVASFKSVANEFEIKLVPGYLRFPGRVVVAAHTTRGALERAIRLLDFIAEIRETRATPEFFIKKLRADERAKFIADMADRLEAPPRDDVFIAILDTGINRHPLLDPYLDDADKHSVLPEWGLADREGHGTEMAGIATYGDLVEPLSNNEPVQVASLLESVKIFNERDPVPRHLYGWVTEKATDLVENVDADRLRTFAMAITEIGQTKGFPSEWSATVDRLAFGLPTAGAAADIPDDSLEAGPSRLYVISAGNIAGDKWRDYPDSNTLEGIESPGQAWNALTVGAATELTEYPKKDFPGFHRLADRGQLSPSSRTSRTWEGQWPLKPDVVCEGGNGCIETLSPENWMAGPSDLQLLTTSKDAFVKPLIETGDTSAATAGVARLTAWVSARYPDYWPETVRALVVHGAVWLPSMRALLGKSPGMEDKFTLLRNYGFGLINFERTLRSASERATLVLQQSITPYALSKTGKNVVLGDMHMHALPWPAEELERLGQVKVRMHVTLSYFVEPNPSQRGWRSKFRYQSHGLRFAVRGTTESEKEFAARVNAADREEDETGLSDPDSRSWFIGARVRNRGCIHRDYWEGTGQQLAAKSHVAVFPVGGWWKDTGNHSLLVRYGLIVSIEVVEDIDVSVDLYTPIKVAIANVVAVPGRAP